MFPKFKNKSIIWLTLKQEHLTMLVQKCGETNHMIPNLIFGLLDVWFIKCAQAAHLSKEKILNLFINKFKEVFMKTYPLSTLSN